ncbi:MAG: hypothetical protein JWM59_2653 [Verrucomicrobiales bacterium]|nr:hypothetical protein [Verrucomicrobiales bacterium]
MMEAITDAYLNDLWSVDCADLKERYSLHAARVREMDIPTAGVVGRDLLIRRQALFIPRFYLAAFLATETETGNDGFLDFTDSVAVLPEDQYKIITDDPDRLVEHPISAMFAELGFVQALVDRFDELAGLEPDTELLDHLVFGSGRYAPWELMQQEATSSNARIWLPRLFARSGRILKQ